MPANFHRFFNINHFERFLFLKAGLIASIYSCIIFFFPFKWYVKWLGEKDKPELIDNSSANLEKIKRIERAMLRVKRYFPWRIKCLASAMAAKYLLGKMNISSTIFLGVTKENPEKIIAHAWLQCSDITVTGKEEKAKFTALVFFT
jgi:hypothetical protein